MDGKYPHWYHECEPVAPCCEAMEKDDVCCEDGMPHKLYPYQEANFKDRLLCLLGDEVLFSVDACICKHHSFCGTLCYVGCDFIIVNVCLHRKPVSIHVPIKMLRFIAPFKSRHRSSF